MIYAAISCLTASAASCYAECIRTQAAYQFMSVQQPFALELLRHHCYSEARPATAVPRGISASHCPESSHTAVQHRRSLTRLTHRQPSAARYMLNATHSCKIKQPVLCDHSPHLWLQVCWLELAQSGRRTPCRPMLLTGPWALADVPAAARFAGRLASPPACCALRTWETKRHHDSKVHARLK